MRVKEVVSLDAENARIKQQQDAAKAATKAAKRAALSLKVRKANQQLQQLSLQTP
jgi:hypothetical protein